MATLLESFASGRQIGADLRLLKQQQQQQEAQAQQQQVVQQALGTIFGGGQTPQLGAPQVPSATPPIQPPAGAVPVLGQPPATQPGVVQPQTPVTQPGVIPSQPGQTQDQAIAQVFARNPAAGEALLKSIGAKNQFEADDASRRAFGIRNTPFGDRRNAAIERHAAELERQGSTVRAGQLRSLLDLTQQDQDQTLRTVEIANLGTKEREELQKPIKPTTLQQNLAAAGLTPGTPEFQDALLKGIFKPSTQINIGPDGEPLTLDEQIERTVETKKAAKLGEVRGKGIADREAEDIASGSEAARTIPNMRRSIELLGGIETGGIDAAILKGKQLFGIESANEAELVNAMSKQVIAQLKPVFGAQFTKAEGDWLKAIEAGPTKSTEGNLRLLERGIVLAKKRSEIGLEAAIQAKDFRSAQEIQDFLELDLTPGEEKGPDQPQRIKFNAQGKIIQ